ncbi:MAG: paraquat-inducible protein A, partial [Bdellovibrionales bacterium]|nr:paraquat-inducible protein A [Bdellovibrionales bacterium]
YLLVISGALLGAGLTLPAMTVVPGYGDYTPLIAFFEPDLSEVKSFSIFDSVLLLWEEGKYFVSLIIAAFSVVFPIWKLCVLWKCVELYYNQEDFHGALKWIEKLGKFSMLDVYVIALLVLIIKGLPGGTQIQVGSGVIAFALSVILTMLIPKAMTSRNEI